MSSGSTGREQYYVQGDQFKLYNSIGAVDLVSLGNSKYGHLRKKVSQPTQRFKALAARITRQWKQYFVVIHRGCIYLYNDETSRSYSKLYALTGYHRIRRCEEEGYGSCFVVEPQTSADATLKSLTFSCVADEDRLLWMRSAYASLLTANDKLPPDKTVLDSMGYFDIERSLSEPDEEGPYHTIKDEALQQTVSTVQPQRYNKFPVSEKEKKKPKNRESKPSESSSEEGRITPPMRTSKSPNYKPPNLSSEDSDSDTSVYENTSAYDDTSTKNTKQSSAALAKNIASQAAFQAKNIQRNPSNIDSTARPQKPTVAKKPNVTKDMKQSSVDAPGQRDISTARYLNLAEPFATKVPDQSARGSVASDPYYENEIEDITADYENDALDYMLDDSNAERAKTFLKNKPPYTFLIRNSKEGKDKVLMVKTQSVIMNFKLNFKDNKYCIGSETYDSVVAFVSFYRRREFKNINHCLELGYRSPKIRN